MSVTDFESQHFVDAEGVPDGGVAYGPGFTVSWQRGALVGRPGVPLPGCTEHVKGGCEVSSQVCKRRPNGSFVQTLILVVIDRIEHYQSTRFASEENKVAIAHLRAAYDVLDARQRRRESEGTAGTHHGN